MQHGWQEGMQVVTVPNEEEKDIIVIGPVGHEEIQATLKKATEAVQNLGGVFGVAEARLMALAKSEVIASLDRTACHYVCPNDLIVMDANEAHLIKGDLHPRPDKRFKCLGAKRGSIYDYKKGYVKRSKKDVFRKK